MSHTKANITSACRADRCALRGLFSALVLCLTLALPSTARAITSSDEGRDSTVTLYDDKGSLGIGSEHPTSKLDVHEGEVRVGDSGAACTKANEGAIRYAKPNLEFCNSTNWLVVNAAPAVP
jgi:hypothetical protein